MLLLEGRLARQGLALGPGWAALCGVVASGGFHWSAADGLRLAAVLFLVEAGWASVWTAVTSPVWAEPLRRWALLWARARQGEAAESRRAAFWLPYLRPDAPGGRLSQALSELRAWWATSAGAMAGPALSSLLLAAPLSLLIGALLGPRLLLLTLAAFALTQLAFALSPSVGQPGLASRAAVLISLPWLAGHAAFAPLNMASLGLALAYSLAYIGLVQLEQRANRIRTSLAALGLLNLGQIAAIALLLADGHILGAGLAGLLAFPALIMQPWLAHGLDGDTFVRRAQWPLMAAMLAAVGLQALP